MKKAWLGIFAVLAGGVYSWLGAGPVNTTPPTTASTRNSAGSQSRPARVAPPVVKLKPGQKYVPATPEEIEGVKTWAGEEQKATEEKLGIKLASLETTHFQIMTDWGPQEYSFLKNNFEAAYSAVTKQFGISDSENIFVGKLPCFVFVKYDSFARFLGKFEIKGLSPDVQGMYVSGSMGLGFMVVHKPEADRGGKIPLDEAIKFWKYVLTHEMTHAFVARYISNVHVVTWLNEGIAEVIASERFPRDVRGQAQDAAHKYKNLDKLFEDDGKMKSADMYPVMRTLTEVLVKRDHHAFIAMFDDIKRGAAPDVALQEHYHWTYAQLEAVWRIYVK